MDNDGPYPKRFFIRLILIAVFLWVASWVLLMNLAPNFETRGQFGDMFGAVNSLFSGLALAGVVYTVLLQQEEIKRQRIEEHRNEVARQQQLELITKQLSAMEEQLRLQRNADMPVIQWRGSSGNQRAREFQFINKGGRVRITAVRPLDNHRIRANFSPRAFVSREEKGSVTFDGDEETLANLTVTFELHYEATHGAAFDKFKIKAGRLPEPVP